MFRRISGMMTFGRGNKTTDATPTKPPHEPLSVGCELLARARLAPLRLGISLRHLASLPVEPDANFNALCAYIKKVTLYDSGYRSYALHLLADPLTRHFVSFQPQVFVSYPWSGVFRESVGALIRNIPAGQDDIFVWMDVALVDQHAAAETNINFQEWTETFGDTLRWIGKAFLLLSPGKKPIAITRSWCCFEIYVIKATGIEYVPCMAAEDEEELIEEIRSGALGSAVFQTLFGAINVETATAFKDSDRVAILEMMREFGVVAVNDVVMLVIKKWLVNVAEQAEDREDEGTRAMVSVLNTRGQLHQVLGELHAALPYYTRAVENARKESSGCDDQSVAAMEGNLATLLQEMGDFASAEPLMRESLATYRAAFKDEDHPLVATGLGNLATLLKSKGEYASAEPLMRESIAIFRNVYGNDNHPNIANGLGNLAGLLLQMGEFVGAEPLMRESLAIYREVLGNDHPLVATGLGNLAGLLLEKQGDFAAAELLMREALAINKKVLGEDHPLLTTSLGNLAELLRAKGDLDAAEPLMRESLAINRKVLGNDHPLVAACLGNLGALLTNKQDYANAEALFRESLALSKKLLGDDHPDVATAKNNLGVCLKEQSKISEARTMFEEALEIRRRVLGDNHPDLASTLNRLASIHQEQGHQADAKRCGGEALLIYEHVFGPDHPQTAKTRIDWGCDDVKAEISTIE